MNIDLDAIQNRSDDAMMHESLEPGSYAEIAWHSARDVPALLAYARDLEARVKEAKAVALEDAADEAHNHLTGMDGSVIREAEGRGYMQRHNVRSAANWLRARAADLQGDA